LCELPRNKMTYEVALTQGVGVLTACMFYLAVRLDFTWLRVLFGYFGLGFSLLLINLITHIADANGAAAAITNTLDAAYFYASKLYLVMIAALFCYVFYKAFIFLRDTFTQKNYSNQDVMLNDDPGRPL